MTLSTRLAALERQKQRGGDTQIVLIRGGFEEMMCATAGDLDFARLDGETEAAFTDRVHRAAREARKPFVVIGGFPPDEDIDLPPAPPLPVN